MNGCCAVCDAPYWDPMGALCEECDAVTDTFTDADWTKVEKMTPEAADEFLRKRKAHMKATR